MVISIHLQVVSKEVPGIPTSVGSQGQVNSPYLVFLTISGYRLQSVVWISVEVTTEVLDIVARMANSAEEIPVPKESDADSEGGVESPSKMARRHVHKPDRTVEDVFQLVSQGLKG